MITLSFSQRVFHWKMQVLVMPSGGAGVLELPSTCPQQTRVMIHPVCQPGACRVIFVSSTLSERESWFPVAEMHRILLRWNMFIPVAPFLTHEMMPERMCVHADLHSSQCHEAPVLQKRHCPRRLCLFIALFLLQSCLFLGSSHGNVRNGVPHIYPD